MARSASSISAFGTRGVEGDALRLVVLETNSELLLASGFYNYSSGLEWGAGEVALGVLLLSYSSFNLLPFSGTLCYFDLPLCKLLVSLFSSNLLNFLA